MNGGNYSVAPASRRPDGRAECPPDSRRDAGATGETVRDTSSWNPTLSKKRKDRAPRARSPQWAPRFALATFKGLTRYDPQPNITAYRGLASL